MTLLKVEFFTLRYWAQQGFQKNGKHGSRKIEIWTLTLCLAHGEPTGKPSNLSSKNQVKLRESWSHHSKFAGLAIFRKTKITRHLGMSLMILMASPKAVWNGFLRFVGKKQENGVSPTIVSHLQRNRMESHQLALRAGVRKSEWRVDGVPCEPWHINTIWTRSRGCIRYRHYIIFSQYKCV